MSQQAIFMRSRRLVNTDPQRRCYNGCNYSEALVWTQWELLDYDATEERVKWWQELNDYVVSQRGKSAKSEFKIGDVNDPPK